MAKSSGSSTIRVGKYTPTSHYSGRITTESYKCPPMHKVSLPGGRSAKVVKCPPRPGAR